MIMRTWMHWFWITTSYFKAFLFFTAQTISFSCISHPFVAEAGLLENQTFTPLTPKYYKGNDSSQLGDHDPNVSSPTVVSEGNRPPETTPRQLSTLGEDASAEETSTPKSEDAPRTGFTGDLEDTYNGETLDVFQYPLKKFAKYAHLKYGKVKAKGRPSNETGGDERKTVENDPKVDTSVAEPDGLKSENGSGEGGKSEPATSDAPDVIITTAEGLGNVSAGEADASFNSSSGGVSEVLGPPEEDQILKNETLMIENKVEERGTYTTVEPSAVKNRVAASTSAQNFEVQPSDLNVGSITGITLGILVVFSLFGAVSFVLYRRRYLNKPQVLHDKCSNLDSSGYIDETSLRENSEEMYSLDNDSFLNSLEAMTIQNYWTENVKHTKL